MSSYSPKDGIVIPTPYAYRLSSHEILLMYTTLSLDSTIQNSNLLSVYSKQLLLHIANKPQALSLKTLSLLSLTLSSLDPNKSNLSNLKTLLRLNTPVSIKVRFYNIYGFGSATL